MSSVRSLAAARQSRADLAQKSQPNGFGGAFGVRVVPVVDPAEFRAWWAALLRRRCGGDVVTISRMFARTEQTGRNWLSEASTPLAHDLDLANALWPEDFIARHAPGLLTGLRVAA